MYMHQIQNENVTLNFRDCMAIDPTSLFLVLYILNIDRIYAVICQNSSFKTTLEYIVFGYLLNIDNTP